MNHKRKAALIVGIVFVAITATITTYFIKSRFNEQSTNTVKGTSENQSETYKKYAALMGENYDKAFLANMIVHHESAMNMAEMATSSANRQEIRDLAFNISTSQGKEVSNMTILQSQWGYPITSGHNMTDMENASDSMMNMATMGDELKSLTGDVFDKRFLELMIVHHQEAIDMAEPAQTHAKHQEVKEIAKAIISAQKSEIEQMQRWQKGRGFQTTNGKSTSLEMSR